MTRMPKNELPLVISYLTAAAGLVWILHIMGNYYVTEMRFAGWPLYTQTARKRLSTMSLIRLVVHATQQRC